MTEHLHSEPLGSREALDAALAVLRAAVVNYRRRLLVRPGAAVQRFPARIDGNQRVTADGEKYAETPADGLFASILSNEATPSSRGEKTRRMSVWQRFTLSVRN